MERIKVVSALRAAGLTVQRFKSRDKDEYFVTVGATQKRLEVEAEANSIPVKLNERHGGGYTEFKQAELDFYEGSGEGNTFSFRTKERVQLIKSIMEGSKRDGDAGLDLDKLVYTKKMKTYFAVHGPSREKLFMEWAKSKGAKKWYQAVLYQPLDDVRDYFGSVIALYFGFLGCYTKYLFIPGIVGLLGFILQIALTKKDTILVPLFAVFFCLWSTVFLEAWKRERATLTTRWGVDGASFKEETRPAFDGEVRKSPITGQEEVYYPSWKRRVKFPAVVAVIFTMIGMVVAALIGIIAFKIVIQQMCGCQNSTINTTVMYEFDMQHPVGVPVVANCTYVCKYGGKVLGGIVNGIVIAIFNAIYKKVATTLTKWENHRTMSSFETSLVIKSFLFQFVNSYVTLFYIAFFRPFIKIDHMGGFFQAQGCQPEECMTDLFIQLLSIFGTQLLLGNFKEVVLPYIMARIKMRLEEKKILKTGQTPQPLSRPEAESKLGVYPSTFDDYNELILQFGYVTFFAAACPIVSFFALLNNILEIRVDSIKLCRSLRRPEVGETDNIGAWRTILHVMNIAAVMVNCGIVLITSDTFSDDPADYNYLSIPNRFLVFIVAEHALFLLKIILDLAIPDVPAAVEEERLRKDFKTRSFHKQRVHTAEEERTLTEDQMEEFEDSDCYMSDEETAAAVTHPMLVDHYGIAK
mmetsp:Transcript_20824/g.53741  ORF Transcript_20824/g.53741 Transcript_20824/m.53741 type:complete len:693 (-) Transcript_20824:468-2546(-)